MPFPEAVRSVPAIRAASDPDAAKLLEMLKRADATFERACPSARLKRRSMHSNVCCGYSHGRPTPTHACPGGMTQRLVVQNDVEERVVGGHCVARPDIVLRSGSSGRTLLAHIAHSWPCRSGPAQVRIQARLAGVERALLPKRGTTRGATNGRHFRLCGFHLPPIVGVVRQR